MKAYERRSIGKEDYCNLDIWDEQIGCWKKTARQYDNEESARLAAKNPGRYRISKTENGIRTELEPFKRP